MTMNELSAMPKKQRGIKTRSVQLSSCMLIARYMMERGKPVLVDALMKYFPEITQRTMYRYLNALARSGWIRRPQRGERHQWVYIGFTKTKGA